jgi:proteasome lid subunit RPN8/RPN11
MSNIVLETKHRRAIAQHGEALYPRECRGILLGHQQDLSKEVKELLFLDPTTELDAQEKRYHILDQEIQRGREAALAQGMEIVGFFFSHIDQPARPSIQDRKYVEPSLSYVLVGVRQGRAHELASWVLSQDGMAFYQEDIRGA